MARRHIEHNRLLLTWNMMKGGLNPVEAWRESGKKIKRSLAQINRKKSAVANDETVKFVRDGI